MITTLWIQPTPVDVVKTFRGLEVSLASFGAWLSAETSDSVGLKMLIFLRRWVFGPDFEEAFAIIVFLGYLALYSICAFVAARKQEPKKNLSNIPLVMIYCATTRNATCK